MALEVLAAAAPVVVARGEAGKGESGEGESGKESGERLGGESGETERRATGVKS